MNRPLFIHRDFLQLHTFTLNNNKPTLIITMYVAKYLVLHEIFGKVNFWKPDISQGNSRDLRMSCFSLCNFTIRNQLPSKGN